MHRTEGALQWTYFVFCSGLTCKFTHNMHMLC